MNELIIIAGMILMGLVLIGWYLGKKINEVVKSQTSEALLERLKIVQETMRGTTGDVARLMQENTKQLNQRLDMAAVVIGDLKRNLGEMSEVGRGIKSLQEFLQSPKLRGNIGEQVLSDMIGQSFPKNSIYLQHAFKSGLKVDAALKTDGGLLCIDSKFPMENFKLVYKGETEREREVARKMFISDVKKHISSIGQKYILTEEGTMDFALMYIPSESVYYEIVNIEELMDYSRKARVYPVSPNTLYAHLQVILTSLQGKQMEKKSHQVLQLLRAAGKDYEKVEESMSVLGGHIGNAYNKYSEVQGKMVLMGQKLNSNILMEDNDQKKLPESGESGTQKNDGRSFRRDGF